MTEFEIKGHLRDGVEVKPYIKTIDSGPEWLGKPVHPHDRESFPPGDLNEKQIRTLFSIEDGGRRVVDLGLHTAIYKITESIREVHTLFGHPKQRSLGANLIFWLDAKGKYLAAVEEKYEGPSGVHKPGDKFRKWGVGYYRDPQMVGFAKAYEREFERGLWCIGNQGAVPETREFVREVWVNGIDMTAEGYWTAR
jgi:hypothetical protein